MYLSGIFCRVYISVRLSNFSQLYLIPCWGGFQLISSIYLLMIIRVFVRHLNIISKSEIWIIRHCLGLGNETLVCAECFDHDDVIKWKHFPRYWPFVRAIHRQAVNSPHKGQWRGALMFSLICTWTNGWVNSRDAGDLRRHHTHYDVTVMILEVTDNVTAHFTMLLAFRLQHI